MSRHFLEQALARLQHDGAELKPGEVWLAGAGPGDPGLLTLDVLSALAQADALVHDALVPEKIVAVAQQAEKNRTDALASPLPNEGSAGASPSAPTRDTHERSPATAPVSTPTFSRQSAARTRRSTGVAAALAAEICGFARARPRAPPLARPLL